MKLSNKILIPSVFLLFLLCIGGAYFLPSLSGDRLTVRVYKDTKLIESVELGSVSEPYEIDLGTNVICIESGGVYMKSASCPDRLCVKRGKIKRAGQSIVCLPNRITVEIEGKKSEVDAVAGAR